MSLTCKVKVSVNNISEKQAIATKNALSPDNVDFPKGLSLKINESNRGLDLNFESEGDTKKLVSTIDEVLEHVKVSMEVTK